MFFGNPDLLQRNLHTDLNALIKNVKAREDQYLTLLQYNKNLIANLSEIEHTSFLTDEVNKHKAYINTFLTSNPQVLSEEAEIMEKYEYVQSGELGIIKLMSRVAARVLEICQASYEKAKFLDPCLNDKYNQFRNGLLENLNEKVKINVSVLLISIIEYIQSKYNKEIQRLQDIISILATGNFEALSEVYAPRPQPKKSVEIEKRQEKKIQINLQKERLEKERQRERQERLERMRQEQQIRDNIEKAKKKKAKAIRDVVAMYSSTMDLAKQQFIQDFSYSNNPEEKRRRLYEQLFTRNRLNSEQIAEFQSKKNQFQQKIKEFKERMEEESKKIQQALVVVINKTQLIEPKYQEKIQSQSPVKQSIGKQTKSEIGNDDEFLQTMIPEKLQKILRRRQAKPTVKAQSPCYVKQVAFSSMHMGQQTFQHIKFDTKNQQIFTRSNRARLPQIHGRSSLDNRYQGKNTRAGSDKKDQKRINIMKNVQIGVNALSIPLAKNLIREDSLNKRSPRDRPLVQPLFENVANGTSNGLEYTFYVRKKVTKFYETRTNFLL